MITEVKLPDRPEAVGLGSSAGPISRLPPSAPASARHSSHTYATARRNEGSKRCGQLFVACSNASVLFDSAEEPLYEVTVLVLRPIDLTHQAPALAPAATLREHTTVSLHFAVDSTPVAFPAQGPSHGDRDRRWRITGDQRLTASEIGLFDIAAIVPSL